MSVKPLHTVVALVALLGILGFFGLTHAPIAHALPPPVSLVVTKTADTNDGVCDADCSLREAITVANANTPLAETITFSVSGTITLGSSLPAINDDLTIDGTGQTITVSGNNAVRPLGVLSGKTLSLNHLTLANGYCSAGCAGGAAIVNVGTLNIANSTFSGNSASVAAGFGGGSIFNNTGGTVNIANSTFSGNSVTGANNNGGAILNNTGGTVNIANSTFYGNSATDLGGGFINFGTVNLKNSILSGNTAGSSGGDCYNNTGATINGSNNLVDNTSCSGSGSGSLGRIAAVTNFDTTAADNGGPTNTHKLNGGSNALEAVPSGQCTYLSSGTNPLFTNAATIAADQRGVLRPQNTLCDVGAYELLYCAAGSYDNGSASCAPAPVGYYVPAPGSIAATPCAPGTWQDQQGQTSCNPADPGFFVPVMGSSVQTACPTGSNSLMGAVACFQTGPNFVVNDASDTDDSACDALPGDCTLREAINAANGLSGADTITFDILDTGADCASNNVCTITLGSYNFLPILDDVTINGAANGAQITVSGANTYRVMTVSGGITLNVNTLTIADGYCVSCAGAGIYSTGTVNVTNSTLRGNSGTPGGGIFNDGGTLNIANSTFSANTGTGGGGVYNLSGTLNIANSTFSNNVGFNGGGVFNFGSPANITNSTFSGNSATNGGAIYNLDILNLQNSIITNTLNGGDCKNGGTIEGSNNLIDDTSCGNFLPFRLGAVTNFDTTLADNGGTTETHKLNADSNAIGAVPAGQCTYVSSGTNPLFNDGDTITTDQRGTVRPQGLFCDVGAYELVYTGFQTGPNFVVNSAADTNDNSCDTLGQGIGNKDCTLREAINAANTPPASTDTITFDIPDDAGALCSANNVCTITLSALGTLPAINDDVTIDGAPNSGDITVDGASTYKVMIVNSGKTVTLERLTIANGNCAPTCLGSGGIDNSGTLTVRNSTFTGNLTGDGGLPGYGGAIQNKSGGNLNVLNSTFSGNKAFNTGAGGAIANYDTLTVTNSTFYNNQAASGGGISNTGTMNVINSTFSDSLSFAAIENYGTANLYNTIVDDVSVACSGTITADAYNLASDGTCGSATTYGLGQISLGTLADNGGPTQTMALGNSSVAIDAGDPDVCDDNPGPNNLDQRGKARNDLQCDVGAFEFVDTDGDTISKAWTTNGTQFTFGPTLADMLLNSGSPLTLVVKREPGAIPPGTPPANALPILWDATTKESPFSLTVTLCYDSTGLTPTYENSLHVWHYNGSTWDDLGGTLDTVTHAPYHCVTATTALTSLSPLLLAPGNTTAVDVTGVKAAINKKGNVVVKWRTTSESQIAGFNVYRKTGKGEWIQVNANFIQAKNAGGTEGNKYRFADKQAKAGKTYRYKIEVKYLDNHSEWTKPVRVKTP